MSGEATCWRPAHVSEKSLPNYPGFGGKVGRVFATSESWWPERPTPPEGAPNIVVILCDDLGFADTSPYGSEIETPNIARLAKSGLQFTNFHSTPMCSPTRAAFLTGMEPHAAGVGTVAHADPGFPGYAIRQISNHEFNETGETSTGFVGYVVRESEIFGVGNSDGSLCIATGSRAIK